MKRSFREILDNNDIEWSNKKIKFPIEILSSKTLQNTKKIAPVVMLTKTPVT